MCAVKYVGSYECSLMILITLFILNGVPAAHSLRAIMFCDWDNLFQSVSYCVEKETFLFSRSFFISSLLLGKEDSKEISVCWRGPYDTQCVICHRLQLSDAWLAVWTDMDWVWQDILKIKLGQLFNHPIQHQTKLAGNPHRASRKNLLEFKSRATWMSQPNFTAIHPVVVCTFQFESKYCKLMDHYRQ